MADDLVHELPEAMSLALASGSKNRDIWLVAFALDARIGGYVLGAREPLLAQMRIAWWRDELRNEADRRPRGDLLLDCVGEAWPGDTSGLIGVLDGWESLLGEQPLGDEALASFVDGRQRMCAAIAARLHQAERTEAAICAGHVWALAELAYRLPSDSDRESARQRSLKVDDSWRSLPRDLRPLAVLAGLARRSLAKGGAPLVGDRLSPLAALRLGLIGR